MYSLYVQNFAWECFSPCYIISTGDNLKKTAQLVLFGIHKQLHLANTVETEFCNYINIKSCTVFMEVKKKHE